METQFQAGHRQSGDLWNNPESESAVVVEGAGAGSGTFRGVHPLTYRELRRRLWHMAPGVLASLLLFVPHRDPISPVLMAVILCCCGALVTKILLGFRQIQRQGEGTGTAAVSGYALSVMLTILLFPRHLEIGLGVLAVLAFGDGSATLFGLLLRGPRLPWNPAKSWSGLTAFVLAGTMAASLMYWGEAWNPEAADPPVSLLTAVLIVLPAVMAAGLSESLRSSINDNVRVGVTAAVCLTGMHFLMRTF